MDLTKLKTNKMKIGPYKNRSMSRIHINITMEILLAPMTKNFKQFELENPGIQLNVFTAMPDASTVPISPMYVGMNKFGHEVNILL